MQDLWALKLHWDESVPLDLHTKWQNFYEQLRLLNQLSFPRKSIINNAKTIELHGFCDASEKGYGACFYIKTINDENESECKLFLAKSRVAPLKTISIAKLELSGAQVLAKLFIQIKNIINISFNKITFWTDSTIVLQWLNTSPHLLKTFVANRVSDIQNQTEIKKVAPCRVTG